MALDEKGEFIVYDMYGSPFKAKDVIKTLKDLYLVFKEEHPEYSLERSK